MVSTNTVLYKVYDVQLSILQLKRNAVVFLLIIVNPLNRKAQFQKHIPSVDPVKVVVLYQRSRTYTHSTQPGSEFQKMKNIFILLVAVHCIQLLFKTQIEFKKGNVMIREKG
ncbi:Hypothetical_protein [Hexamita inflata]|uniref:Hypothetical_protein n=1 Tax=Hexamita inflata TaxID=28002 RepID=A0ABP1I3V6_9EUKA